MGGRGLVFAFGGKQGKTDLTNDRENWNDGLISPSKNITQVETIISIK